MYTREKVKPDIVYRKGRYAIEKRSRNCDVHYRILEIVASAGLYIEWPSPYGSIESAKRIINSDDPGSYF